MKTILYWSESDQAIYPAGEAGVPIDIGRRKAVTPGGPVQGLDRYLVETPVTLTAEQLCAAGGLDDILHFLVQDGQARELGDDE